MKFVILLMMITLTACTPTLAPQPVHTVNPVPALTKRHTNEQFDDKRLADKWLFDNAKIVGNAADDVLLNQLTKKAHIVFGEKDEDNQLKILASSGCNVLLMTRLLDERGHFTNPKSSKRSSTLKSCGQSADRVENRFGAFLWEAEQIEIVDGVLSLTDKDGNVLTFVRQN